MKKLIIIFAILFTTLTTSQTISSRVSTLEKNYATLNNTLSAQIQQLNIDALSAKAQIFTITVELQRLSAFHSAPVTPTPTSYPPVKAFQTAEGYGKNVTGGRGGTLVKVTNLNDSGVGSFRAAVTVPNRIVVFEVAGYINLESIITVADNITIVGQTAFRNGGQGITLRKSATKPYAGQMLTRGNNIIARYMRFRPAQRQENDCCGDAWTFYNKRNIILDHCSFSYTSDEMIDLSESENVTIQYCIMSEPLSELNPPTNGKIIHGANTKNISFFRNLFANSGQRNPMLTPKELNGNGSYYEYINNYGFNLGYFAFDTDKNGTTPLYINILNNYWHKPANISQTRRWIMLTGVTGSQYYLNDENFDSRYRTSKTGDVWSLLTSASHDYVTNFSVPQNKIYQKLTPHATPIVVDNVALVSGLAVWSTFKNSFGANLYRDAADTRVINQITANNAPANTPSPLVASAFGTDYSPLANMSSVPVDNNNDGIPEAWAAVNIQEGERATTIAPNGYTHLENYFESLIPK